MFKILKGFKGSPDGFTVIYFPTGEIVDLPQSLADVALIEGWAVPFSPIAEITPETVQRKPGRPRK